MSQKIEIEQMIGIEENTVLSAAGEAGSNGMRNYYVSVSKGSEDGNGTQNRPFRKIAHALYYVKPGDTVLVDSGIYHEIFKIPSGEEGKPVTLTAMPGANVIITPAIPIAPEWKPYKDNIYVADIGEYVKDMDTVFPQLFADMDSMVEARYPNMGPSMSSIHDYKRAVAGPGTNKDTIVTTTNLPSDLTGGRVVIWTGSDGASWVAFTSPVASVNGAAVKLAEDISSPDAYTGTDPYTPYPGNPFYITGDLSLLDAPGEYFFDRQTGRLYFYPPWNGRPDTRVLSMRSSNDIAIDAANTSYVNIRNISIYGGGINMRNVNSSIMENCRVNYAEHFYPAGYDAAARPARMILSGTNNRISGCEFGPSAGAGIVIGGSNTVFTNNIVHDTNYAGSDFSGVTVSNGAANLEISHNTIFNSSREHIVFEGGRTVVVDSIKIHNNYFKDHGTLNNDTGAFYAWGVNGGGTEIYNNFVDCGNKNDNGSYPKARDGLYTDNYCSNFIIHHNIVIGGFVGLHINLPNSGTRFYNNTVVGAEWGTGFYSYPVENADAKTISINDNLFVDTINRDITYHGTEKGIRASYVGDFETGGTIPVTSQMDGRMTSSGNVRGTVDAQYRPTGDTPDIGAIPRGGTLFPYGADWTLENK